MSLEELQTEDIMPPARLNQWPTLGVSVVIFSLQAGRERRELSVLLVQRMAEPFHGCWALPGGWVHYGEGLEQAARRHLRTKTGVRPTYLEQLYTFGQPDRDPREHRIAVAYYVLVRSDESAIITAPEREARWFPVDTMPTPLAFDNDEIVKYALWRLRNKVSYAYIAFQLLPPTFTLTQLREVYEEILGTEIDPTNFRRKVEASGTIVPTGTRIEGGAHRPPKLYRCTLRPEQLFTGPTL